MYAFFLVELWAATHEFFAVRCCKENWSVNIAKISFFHVVLLGLKFLHLGFELIVLYLKGTISI